MVAQGVRAAMADAQIADPADVHFVQIKCPLLTAQRIADAESRGQTVATRDTLKSMGLSRAASSLGVAVALGELEADAFADADIGVNTSLWSGRASASAGIELMNHEIVVLGMSAAWSGPLAIDHAVMADGIDIEPVRAALAAARFQHRGSTVRAPIASAWSPFSPRPKPAMTAVCAGKRHTMLDDFDISSTRHARAFVCGALAGLVGHAEIYVSGGAEHQGPGRRRAGGGDRRAAIAGAVKRGRAEWRLQRAPRHHLTSLDAVRRECKDRDNRTRAERPHRIAASRAERVECAMMRAADDRCA